MDEKQQALLREAWGIVNAFREMMMGDVLEKTGTLYMSGTYEDLGTACALIGEALGDDSLGCRVVTDPGTRRMLMDAYQAADMMFRNAAAGSEWTDCCASLMACLFTALNAKAEADGMQAALQSVIQVAQTGLGTIAGIDEAGEDPGWYMNPAGETYAKRRDQLEAAFSTLVPKNITENGGTDNEADQ